MADDLTYKPDYGAKKEHQPNVREVKFGDGYSQRSAQNLNANPQKWSLDFTHKTTTVASTIDAFFASREGWQSFTWTPPGETVARKFTCRKWSRTVVALDVENITAELEEVF